jgi:hypothetical protein
MKWCLVACLALAACNKETPKAQAGDPEFDKQWSALTQQGAEPAFIEGELHGSGLMGEVRRAVDRNPNDSPIAQQVPQLTDADVARVIRAHLAQVKGCYQAEEKSGAVGSGKAILSLEIDHAGAVTGTTVIAPAFAASKLPACISTSAKAWTFPKSAQKVSKKFSYPFVFVGG